MTTRSVRHPQWRLCGVFSLLLVCVATLLLGSGVQVINAVLTDTKVAPVSPIAGVVSDVVVTFTSSVELSVGDQVKVQFPSDFSISTTTSVLVVDSNLYATTLSIASLTTDTVYATIDSSAVSAGSSFQFALTDVTNPPAGTTRVFTITTYDSTSAIIDTDTSVQTISIKSSPFSLATIAPDSLDAGVTGLTTVTFTSDVALPIGSKIVVTFPSEFGVASSRVAAVASLDASSTVAVTPSSSEVVVTIAGSAIASGSTVTFQLDDITNPGAVTTGSFSLESRTSADKVYQQAAAIAPVVITSTTFSVATMSPTSVVAGVVVTLLFELEIGVIVAANGYFSIDVPKEVSIPASAIVVEEQTSGIRIIGSAVGKAVHFQLLSALSPGTHLFTIVGLKSSGSITTGSFAISTADPRGYILQKATTPGLAVVPGNILDAQFKALLSHPGISSQVQVAFTTSAELAQDSLIQIELPSGDYDAATQSMSVVINSPTGITGITSWDSQHSALLILITSAKSVPQDSSVSFTVTSLLMPSSIRDQTTNATIHTWNSAGRQLDGPNAITIHAVTAVQDLASTWKTARPHPGVLSNVVLSFDINGALPVGGKVIFTLPALDFAATSAGGAPTAVFSSPSSAVVTDSVWDTQSNSLMVTVGGSDGILAYTKSVTMTVYSLDTPRSVRPAIRTGAFITTLDSSGGIIDGPSPVQMDEISAGLILGSRTWIASKSYAGVTSDQTVSFFNSGKIVGGSSILITMPDTKWSMRSPTGSATIFTPATGQSLAATTWDGTTRSLLIVVDAAVNIPVSSAITIVIPDVTNPPKETGVCDAYLTTKAPDGFAIDGPASISVMAILRGSFGGLKTWTSLLTTSASMKSDQVLSVSLNGALPSGSFFIIGLPAGGWRFSSQATTVSFSLPSSGVSVKSVSWDASSSELRVETQGDLSEESAIELLIKDMINPYSEQLGSTLFIATILADSGYVDESSDVVVNAIVSSSLAQTGSWISSVATPGVESTQTITLRTGGRLEPGASFCFSLVGAGEWTVSFTTVALLSVTSTDVALMQQTMSWNAITSLLCAEIFVALPQESDIEFHFTKVRSSPSIRAQATATVLIRSHLGGLVNTGSVGINSITKGTLKGALLWQSLLFAPGPVAGLETSAVLSFQCRGRILSGGLISLTLPTEWTLDPVCGVKFVLPVIAGTAACALNQLQITLSDAIDQDSEVKVLVSGVKNPPSVQPSGIALLRTYASDGGVIDDSAALITSEIVSELISIECIGDARTAIVGEKKKFRFEGHNVAKGDAVKFVDTSTTSDLNCGDFAAGVSDAGGIDVAYLTDTLDVELKFSQSSPDNQPFAICYKFGSNPFKLYSNLAFTVKEILAITVNVGMPDMAVANYPKTWNFLGHGVTAGDQVRWINTDVVGDTALLGLNPPDCTGPATLAKLAPIIGVALGAQEDDYTRVIESPSAAVFVFDEQNAGKTFCLCYKFGNEPYKVYPSISIQVNHLRSIDVAASGSKSVAIVEASKPFKFIGEGLLQNDRVYFIETGSAPSCAPSSTNSDLRIAHTIAEQPQTVLFMDAALKTAVNFTDAAAGKKVLPCYQFGSEPYMLYSSILIEVKMVTAFIGKQGSPLLAVADVPEPLTFQGYGLLESDQVRWILRGEEDCESNLASLVTADSLESIDTIELDATQSGVFNFTDTQVDFNPVLCYKFGAEEFKLYTNLRIRIGTVRSKSTSVGEKDVAVVAARKVFTLYGMNLAENDRVGWTTNTSSNCADLSLLIPNPLNLDNDYISYTTVRNEFGVALASLSSGKRVYLCYGFGKEPLKLYANLYLDAKSILYMRSLLGSSGAAVSGALKTFLFQGDGVATGDFAKFVPASKLSCDEPGVLLTNIIKEFDDYAEMAMYLYENVAGVTVGSFRFGSDTVTAGLDRALCYRFGSEPFFFYDLFHIDVKTIWALRQFDRSIGGQDDVAVVNERKLVTIDGVGMSAQDQVKFVDQRATSDQDCLDLAAQGLIGNELRVFKNLSMWLPFELNSNNTKWRLCYKFDAEPFRLYPDIGMNVKEVTNLLDFDAITSATQGRVATISQKKTWSPVGSGIRVGDSAKFVSSGVLSSADCGESNSNIAGGIAAMEITSPNLVFSGTFTDFPSTLSDIYHLCYKFQDEPYSYIRNFELKTYGVLGIDRNVFLAQAATPVQVSGFRLSSTDRLGWTTTNCTNVFAITDVIDQQTTVWFTTAYDKLNLCYSFDRQPFSMFSSISASVVNAEIWIPQIVSVVADQESEMTAAGTFGLTVSSDQIAWVPSDALVCSSDVMTTYASVMQSSVTSTSKSTSPIARGGAATFSVKFVAPANRAASSSSLSTWKLCYRFGNMNDFLMFGDVLCEVRNIDQVELLQAEPGTLGSVMTFQFDGVGTQDFDTAKWISAQDAVTDSDCDTLPAIGGSSTSYVINGLASYTFVQETSGMILCYKFFNHAFKLFSSIPIKDSSSSTSTGSSSSQSPLLSGLDGEREASNSGQSTVNRDIATVSLKLDKNINDIPPGSAAEAQFKASFVSTMARSLGIDPARVQILELLEGSVIVKFRLLPSENLADPLVHEIIQDLTTQLADPQSGLLKSDIITLANSENALGVTMTTPASPAPAPMTIQALGYQRYGLFTFARSVYSVTENTPKLVIPVLRLQGRDSTITLVVQLDLLRQTATYNQDYCLPAAAEDNPSTIFLRFEIGDAVKFIEAEIFDDAAKEGHFEYFTMKLTDPETPGTALGTTPEVVVRIYDYGDGNELVRYTFPGKASKRGDLQKWSVVGNGKNVLRVDGNGIFSVDAVFGEDEYDEKCDLASPTGECAYACDVGGGLSLGTSSSTTPASESNVLRLNGDTDYVVSQTALNAFPNDAFSVSFWVRTTSKNPSACIVSYATISDTMRAIPFAICNPSNLELMINSRSSRDSVATFVNVSNGEWHFILVTWNTEDGRVFVYDNGMPAFDGGPYRVGESLDRSGMFIVGGLTRSGPLNPCRSTVETNAIDGTSANPGVECAIERDSGFVGDVQHVHLWSRILSLTELRKELSWPLQVVSNGLVFGWNFDTIHLLERGRFVNDISTKGQAEKHIGFLHCKAAAASTSSSCLVNNFLPSISPAFPCGQVYSNIWHFAAPPELLIQLRKAYGGRLQYQMLAPSVNGSPRPRRGQLSLFDDAGSHISLALGTFPLPSATEWTSYAVVLREDFGWIKEPSGTPVSATDFQQILVNAAALWIRGDLWGYDASGQGQEVVYLNNIVVHGR